MQGVTIECIIPLFAINSLDHEMYQEVKSRYLTGFSTLANYNPLQLSGVLSSGKKRQRALGITNAPPSNSISNCVSNTPSNPPQNGRPAPQPP